MKPRKTDYGTIILHWLLVAAVGVAFVTGLRIATEAPDRTWINAFDFILPSANVWTSHIEAATGLVAISIAYVTYLSLSGLGRRVQLDKVRLRGLLGTRQTRLGAINVMLSWIFFVTIVALMVSGGLLYFGVLAGYDVMMLHWWAAWVVPTFAGLHILTHFCIGGASQLSRIFRPEGVPPPPPRLDAVELLTLLAERTSPTARDAGDAPPPSLQPQQPSHEHRQPGDGVRGRAARHGARPPKAKRKNVTLQANPFVVAAAVAITGASAFVATDYLAVDTLTIRRINSADAPVLDGDTSDPVWRNAQPYSLMTNQGGNFDGRGESRVEIRAVHDGTWAYFLFTWEDPTRSLKQLPLIKKIDGWHLLHDGYERGDEQAFNEDKFAVLLTTSDADLAGDHTFHASPHPIPDAPSTMTGRGLHFTTTGAYVDVWQWKATSTNGWMDDDHFGPPLPPTPMQVNDTVPYRGGFEPDPGSANYSNNFEWPTDTAEADPIATPRRLPKDLAAIVKAMGQISLDPHVGESDGARWFMTANETEPYTTEVDRLIPVGTVLPGVILSGDFSGDRADVRCAARWASGHWALEVARRLDTKSKYDVPLKTGVFMRVAAFDHSQIRHTRHVRPIRLEVE
ncbi:MAG TPA: ethylbenzene dehydrogenase-related protein [Bradyrhizobium sp.]|uniref:ethylbenzene dehydrogenase-related protein n=1 Tax=Bradyrhizobium sp. TaxID=376 RepID=UPI002BFDCF32|nr:ethylbenzene dehydrogenase-related protein [Bradyrhizobium sp.]HLZ00545.1 ethylbenzene dehydrogenase-related protein [Bradyrhizobium sp.]